MPRAELVSRSHASGSLRQSLVPRADERFPMKLMKRKTRKAIEKSVAKVIKKHGPKIATGIAAGLASSLATLVSTDDSGGGKKKKKKGSKLSNLLPSGKTLAELPGVKQVSEMVSGSDAKKKPSSHKKPATRRKSASKKTKKQAQP